MAEIVITPFLHFIIPRESPVEKTHVATLVTFQQARIIGMIGLLVNHMIKGEKTQGTDQYKAIFLKSGTNRPWNQYIWGDIIGIS